MRSVRSLGLALAITAGCGDDGLVAGDGGDDSTTAASTGAQVPTSAPMDATGGPGSADADASADATTGSPESTGADPTLDSTGGESDTGAPLGPIAQCFDGVFVNEELTKIGPDYDQFGAVPGSHCQGTNHQDIAGVQRAVFLGDSVAVGTPPWAASAYWRGLVADGLEAEFGLEFASGFLMDEGTWKGANILNGQAGVIDSGDFSACAKWGARNDDLSPTQIPQCFPDGSTDLTTLVAMTMGGNDISSLTQSAIAGATLEELWAQAEEIIDNLRTAVEWLKEPGRFPNGVYVVFGNIYEFTDGTGEVAACDVSALAGFDQPVPAPDELAEVVVWMQEQYMDVAVSTGSDMVFMFEGFCGHGFNSDDPTAACYRGPGNENWFDFTCIHPNPVGHAELADMFLQTILE